MSKQIHDCSLSLLMSHGRPKDVIMVDSQCESARSPDLPQWIRKFYDNIYSVQAKSLFVFKEGL